MLTLTIVIPTYNGRRHLERCLPSVCRHAPPGTQILVVDDASSDGTVAWAHATFPHIDVIALPANQGFVGAVNAGLAAARGDIVELLNNDTEVCAGWAEACLVLFEDPTVGSVAPLVLRMDEPEIIDSAGMEYHVCGWAYNRGHNQRIGPAYARRCEVFGPTGSAGFYRRAALDKTGFLVPVFGAYFEDTDLAFRMRWAGFRCLYEPQARVLHQGTSTYGKESDRLTRLISRNEELVFWMDLPLSKLLLGLVPHAGFLTIRLARKLFTNKLGPFLDGKREALAQWRAILERRREVRALAQGRTTAVDLHVAHSAGILRHGYRWLRRRECA